MINQSGNAAAQGYAPVSQILTEFQFGEMLGGVAGTNRTKPGDTGIKVQVTSFLPRRLIYFWCFVSPNSNNFSFGGTINLTFDGSNVGKIPVGSANGQISAAPIPGSEQSICSVSSGISSAIQLTTQAIELGFSGNYNVTCDIANTNANSHANYTAAAAALFNNSQLPYPTYDFIGNNNGMTMAGTITGTNAIVPAFPMKDSLSVYLAFPRGSAFTNGQPASIIIPGNEYYGIFDAAQVNIDTLVNVLDLRIFLGILSRQQ